jgi:ASC-1-like (ASCH) protein
MTVHMMKLSAEPFAKIANGEKVIESRLFDDKRQQIALGDEIIFSENDHPEHTATTKIIGLLRYQSFKNLFADHDPSLFGGDSREFLLGQIKQFYSDEDEQKYGVVGVRLALVD